MTWLTAFAGIAAVLATIPAMLLTISDRDECNSGSSYHW